MAYMAFWIGGIGVLQGVAELRFAIANERGHRPTLYHSDGVLGSLCWGGKLFSGQRLNQLHRLK